MILGFIGNYIFNKTQIPSIVWLLLFGLIVGFAFNIRGGINQELLLTISEFFAAIAIVIILFDGGINTDIYQLFKKAPTISPKSKSHTILGIWVLLKIKFPIKPRTIITPRIIKADITSIQIGKSWNFDLNICFYFKNNFHKQQQLR